MFQHENGVWSLTAVLSAVLLVCGCGDGSYVYRPSVTNPDKSNPPSVGAPLKMEQMKADDIVVWVDGSVMTRRNFDEAIGYVSMMMRRAPSNMNQDQLTAIYRRECMNVIPGFVNAQLLVHEARARKLLTEDELVKRFNEQKDALAKASRKSIDKVAETFPGGMAAIDRMSETRVWQGEMIDKIPPVAVVGDSDVSNFLAKVLSRNNATLATNAMRKAKLEAIRKDILSGKATFEDMAEKHSQCFFKKAGSGGQWGSYRREFFSTKSKNDEVGKAIFNLNVGEISEVLEDLQGYSVVKFLKYDDRFGSTDGEDRLFARIFLKKDPLMVSETFDGMKAQLSQQVKDQAVTKELDRLRAAACIVYPHGTNFFDTASARQGGLK